MAFRMMIISSMYPGYLSGFRADNPGIMALSYEKHLSLLLSGSTEFAASYAKNFSKMGVDVTTVIANDKHLQEKWESQAGNDKRGGNVILRQIRYCKPDVLWVEDQRFIDRDTLKSLKNSPGSIKLMVLCHCAPVTSSLLKKLAYFDHVITCTPGLKQQFSAAGIKTSLVYHGFDDEFLKYCSNTDVRKGTTVFSGSLRQGKGYHAERILLLDYLLKNNIDITLYADIEGRKTITAKKALRIIWKLMKLAGIKNPEKVAGILEYGSEPVLTWPDAVVRAIRKPVFGAGMYRLLSDSKVVLNNHGGVAGDFAGNMRLFEATGAGSCLLTENKSNIRDLFEPDIEVVVYNSKEECADKIRWLIDHEDDRKRIAAAGHTRTLKSHKVSDRCEQMLQILTAELKKIRP